MLACAASADILFTRGYRHLFGVYAPAKRYFIGLMDLMARRGLKTVAILYEDSLFNRDVADGTASWAHRFGLPVAFRQSYADGASVLPHAVEELQRRFPAVQGLVLAAYPPDCYRLIEILAARGWRPPALAQTIAPIHPQFLQKAGPLAEGVFGPSQWEPDDRIPFPGTRQLIRDFEADHGTGIAKDDLEKIFEPFFSRKRFFGNESRAHRRSPGHQRLSEETLHHQGPGRSAQSDRWQSGITRDRSR